MSFYFYCCSTQAQAQRDREAAAARQCNDLLMNQLREQSERILAAERFIAQEATLRIHNQAQGFAAEAAGLITEAARLSGQAKITKLNEAKTAYDRAIVLNTVNKAAYQASQRAIIAQRDYIEEKLKIEGSIREARAQKDLEAAKLQSRIDNVIRQFDHLIEEGFNEKNYAELIAVKEELCELIDEQKINEPYIVNRMLIVETRIARYELIKKLAESGEEELKDAIINLLENEISVLDSLGIKGGDIRADLIRLQKEIDAIEEGIDNSERLQDIGERALEQEERTENYVRETLAQDRQLQRGGRGETRRKWMMGVIFEEYITSGMEQIMQLRLGEYGEVLPAIVIDDVNKSMGLSNQMELIGKKTTLLPLLILQNEELYHWVGLLIKKGDIEIEITYLDSENGELPRWLEESIKNVFTDTREKLSISQLKLEQQRYNNCGPELVENFAYCLTGTRAPQETAIYLHSKLLESSLLDTEEYALKIVENSKLIGFLSNQIPLMVDRPIADTNSFLVMSMQKAAVRFEMPIFAAESYLSELLLPCTQYLYLETFDHVKQISVKQTNTMSRNPVLLVDNEVSSDQEPATLLAQDIVPAILLIESSDFSLVSSTALVAIASGTYDRIKDLLYLIPSTHLQTK